MRERERERERKSSKRKARHGNEWDIKVNADSIGVRKSRHQKVQSDYFSSKTTTFFFSNFPDSWHENGLWKLFHKHGNIVDIFIAKKKSIVKKKVWVCKILGGGRAKLLRTKVE